MKGTENRKKAIAITVAALAAAGIVGTAAGVSTQRSASAGSETGRGTYSTAYFNVGNPEEYTFDNWYGEEKPVDHGTAAVDEKTEPENNVLVKVNARCKGEENDDIYYLLKSDGTAQEPGHEGHEPGHSTLLQHDERSTKTRVGTGVSIMVYKDEIENAFMDDEGLGDIPEGAVLTFVNSDSDVVEDTEEDDKHDYKISSIKDGDYTVIWIKAKKLGKATITPTVKWQTKEKYQKKYKAKYKQKYRQKYRVRVGKKYKTKYRTKYRTKYKTKYKTAYRTIDNAKKLDDFTITVIDDESKNAKDAILSRQYSLKDRKFDYYVIYNGHMYTTTEEEE